MTSRVSRSEAPDDAVSWDQLVSAARGALDRAHAPYSRFRVGAALQTAKGEIFVGVNVENVSFGLTICAERTALGAAVSNGYTSFTALVIAADGTTPPYPCGACRQVLAEFCGDLPIVLVDREGRRTSTSLAECLPLRFEFDPDRPS